MPRIGIEPSTLKIKVLLLALACAIHAPKAICTTLYVESGYWPPITDATLPNYGYGAALAIDALKSAGYTVEYQERPWNRVIHRLKAKQIDIALAAAKNNDRDNFFSFSEPYIWENVAVFSLTPPNNNNELLNLSKAKIAVGRNYSFGDTIDTKLKSNFIETNNMNSMFGMLLSGRVDFVIEYESVGRNYIQSKLGETKSRLIQACLLTQVPLYIMARPDLYNVNTLLNNFNTAIKNMIQDGRYNKTINQRAPSPNCNDYINQRILYIPANSG